MTFLNVVIWTRFSKKSDGVTTWHPTGRALSLNLQGASERVSRRPGRPAWATLGLCTWRGGWRGQDHLQARASSMLVGKGGAGTTWKPCEYADFIWQLNLDAYPLAPLEMGWLSLCLEAISCAEWVSLVDASGCEQWGSDNMWWWLWWWLAPLVF